MTQKPNQQIRILTTLRDYPFLSEAQLRWAWSWTDHVTHRHLWQVRRQGWVRRYPFQVEGQPGVQWLYALTANGLQFLIDLEALTAPEYQKKYNYSISRLRWLAVNLERVYYSRQVLRHLHDHHKSWRVRRWNSETEAHYETQNGWRRVTFHCSANLRNRATGRWVRIVIEWDTGDLPIAAERTHWYNFVKAQSECEGWYTAEPHFPILFYVAQDKERLNEFYELLRGVLRDARESAPYALLTTRADLEEQARQPASPCQPWYAVVGGKMVSEPLDLFPGSAQEPERFWKLRPLRLSFASKQVELEPQNPLAVPRPKLSDLAPLALALHPLEKKLVCTIGSHPLLTAHELASVLESSHSKVWTGLERLTRWQLIQPHRSRVWGQGARSWTPVQAYTLADLGVVYLAATAGLGTTANRLALARGWEKGFDPQVDHSEHTRIGNELFVQLLQYARAHAHAMTWYSEQEARLYLNLSNAQWSGPFQSVRISPPGNHRESEREEENAGEYESSYAVVGSYGTRKEFFRALARHANRFQRFLPDGRAVLQIDNQPWHVAVEIDLTRANYRKMVAKLNYYLMFRRFYLEEPNLCILLVTHHWQRARNLYWLAWERAAQEIDQYDYPDLHLADRSWAEALALMEKYAAAALQKHVLPLYITTKDDLRKNGTDSPIWLRVQEPLGADGRITHTFTKTRCMEYIEEQARWKAQQQTNDEI